MIIELIAVLLTTAFLSIVLAIALLMLYRIGHAGDGALRRRIQEVQREMRQSLQGRPIEDVLRDMQAIRASLSAGSDSFR